MRMILPDIFSHHSVWKNIKVANGTFIICVFIFKTLGHPLLVLVLKFIEAIG